MEFRQIKMEDNRIYHLRRIGPRATLSNAANLMDFHRIVTLIGRSNNMDYVIDSSIRERSIYISRLHARLVREEQNNTHRLFDDSQNGIFVNNIKIGDSIVLQEGNTVTFGHPNGENIQTGEKRRQPDSEYQFIFERCMCANQNKSRTLTSPITNVTLNSNNTVANMTNKTNNEETTSITSMEKTCAFNNNMPSEISLTTEIRTPSLGEESLIFTSIKKTFDEIAVEKCDDEVQQTTRRKSTTVLGEVNEYHSNNWHDLSQFGNRSAAENDNSDEVDNENIAEDDTVQSVSEVRGDNTLKELVSEVKGDNTLKEPMLFHETLDIQQRAELSGVISGTDSNSTGFSTTADTNLKDKESKPLTADQETIDATERMSTDYNISNTYSEAVLCAKQVKIEVNDANDLKDNVLNIDNYDGKRQINCQELDGENQEIDSENRELDGENREFDGENRELVGENQELDGENRELDDENQELDGENRKLDGENQELEDKNRDLDCENQGLDSTSEDLIDKIQNMIDELECLENKDHNIADEEKLLEDDDDQESENHYQRNGGCKALNCKMDYYYQNVVNEDPEFDGDDQELIDADQGSHENEISEQESGEEIQKSNSDNQESIDPRITSNDNLHNAAYVHNEEINKDEDDYEEEIDDEKSDFNVENRESVNVDQVDVASKTLHQDLEADIKTSQVDDPEFDGEDPDLDDNDLTFDDNDSDFDDGGKKFDNNDFKFDGNSSDFDGKDPKFDGGDSEFDGGDSEFGDNNFKFDGNYLDFDPEFEKLDSDTNRISNTNLDKRNLNLVDNEISQHAVNTYDSNVPNEHDNDSSRNVDKENQHAEIVDSEFDKANRIENMCITMSSHEFTTEAESECLAEPSVYIVTTETECGSISLSKSEFTTEAECGSISLSTSEFKTETESESFTKPSVVTTETECGSISLSASEFTTETEYGSISLSTSEFKTETESESLAEPSVVTTETECGSISLSSSEFTTETENGSIAESASQFTTEAECGSICLSTSEVTTETENESLGKFSVVTNEIAHGTIGSSSQDLSNETEGESLAESSEVKPVTATESESLAESSVVTTRTECDDLSQSTQESKITIEKEILAESSVVMTETEHVTINQCLPCVTTETERIFQSSEKLSVKNESSSKSVEQTNLLERSEFGMGGDETAVKLTERTIILDSKDGLKEIEFVETETRNKLKEYRIERQDTVAKIIPTELKTTKNYEPSEIKLIEYNEILTELKTTKNCEPSEIKLVENNEIEPFDLNCTCVKELSERCIDTAVKIEKRESFELANYKDNFLKDLDENIGYSRKRKLPSEFDSSFQNIGKKIHIDTGFVSDMVSGFFRIREIVAKQSEVDTKTLKRKLVDKMVRNFFERFTKSDAPKEMCCNLSDNLEFLSILESVSMWTKKSLKYLVKNDLKALEINGLCNESLAGDNIVNKSSTASTENCNSLESILINKLSQTQPAHAHSDFEMSQENLEDYMKFRSDSPSEYELVIIGPHHLVNGFNDQKVYGTANNSMFENEVSVYGNKEEKSKKLDTEEILCENRKATKSIMSSEVNLTKEVNMENVDRDQGLTQYTGESQDVHNDLDLTQCIGEFQDVHHDLDLTQCTGESQDVHHDLDLTQCTGESQDVHHDLDLTQCIGESEDVHHNLYLTQCTGESQDVHPDLNLTQCIGESQVVHNDLYLTQCTGESQDIHHDLDLTQCTGESQNVHPDLNDKQQLELSQEHTTDIMVENKAQFSSQHYMKISPDGNCGGISKYLTSKIGDSKHDDDEKVQHKNMVPVHNMLRGYIVSGASVGDAISIMGTSAGDDNDMVGTTSDDERLIMDLDRENSDINNTMCENKVYTNLKTKETPSSMIRSDTEKSTNMIFDEGIKDSDSNCIQMLPLNVDEVTLKSNLVRNDAESIVEELPHIQDECYDLDDGESLDKIGTSGDGDDRIHNVANAETATTSIYHKGKEYINLDVMIDSEENLNDIDAEEKLDVINAEQTLDVIDGDEDVCVFSAAENMDDSTDSVIMLPPTENFSYSRNVLPSPDLYFDDSDSLPEVEFLKESPVKHPVIIKDEIFKVDSGLVSDQDTVIIPFNKALIASTLVVDKNNTSSKSDMNKCAKKEFVFHSTPRDDAASSGKKCVRIPDCTPTNGKVKAETSTPQKHKLKLTKCEKKKKETSLPRKNICQKELGENDNNPRKCKYKRKDFSPRTKTSQRETGTNENIPCKSRLRKRRLDNSPKINDTPAKEGKKSKKKRKMGKHHSRIISDDIEIITDNESDIELTNEKQTMVKSEKLNKSLQRKNEPSIVEFTDERSVTHNSVNQKEDFSFGSKTYVWQENDNENQNEEQLNGSASDIDNISSEDSMSLLSSQQNTMTVDYQHEPPQEEGSELSICYSNTMVANSVTDDDSICFDILPALKPPKIKKTNNWQTRRKNYQKNEKNNFKLLTEGDFECSSTDDENDGEIGKIVDFLENETVCYSDIDEDQKLGSEYSCMTEDLSTDKFEVEIISPINDNIPYLPSDTAPFCSTFNEDDSECLACRTETSTANELKRELNIKTEKDTETFWENSHIFSTVTSGTADDTSTSNVLQRELNTKIEKDSEMLWENSHIFSTVTPGTADDTSTANDVQRELNIKTEKDSETFWENSHIFSTVTPGTADDTSTANDVQRELNIKTEKDSEMLWENSHICSAVTSGTTDDTSTANDLKRELNIKTEKDNKTWENSNIFSTVTSGTTDDSVSYTQGSSNGNMQKFFRKDKKGINRLLEKCKANIKKLVFPKVEVMHMMQNEAGPSNNTGPDSRMGVSSDLDRCKELILKLTNTLGKEQGVENRNRVEAWREQLKELDGKCSVPSVTVGVVGSTGTGKSSLLNAIIDEYNVLPTSGTQACTAVVVKIQNNYNNNDLYEADIEFLSTEEWDYELQLLKKDLTDKNGKMKKKKKMNISPESEAGVAYLKITAVYGEFDSFEDLEKQTNITSYLGKTETIKSEWASDFRNQVDKFIENTTAKTGQFWPIIKSVTIRIPRCGVCSSGVTLVDLPGVGDANAARDKIAQEYLQNCSVILIATEISRACSSKTAKHLRDENFRRQLLMDGQYGNVAFVCTKNDVLSPTELIRELKLEDKTDHLRKNLNAMNIRVDELNKVIEHLKCVDEIQKHTKEMEQMSPAMEPSDALSRKNKELSQDKQNEIESLEAKKNKLEKEMASTRKTIKLICAKARTEFVSKEIKKDFKTGIKEMKKKAKMTQEKIEEDDEDSTDSDDDDDNDVDDSHLTNYCENLKVFCVSSSEYQKLKNKLTDDGPPMVFDCEEDTGIPAVRQFVQKIAEQKEKEATKRLIQNLALFISDIEDYLGITCENNRAKVQSAVTHFSSRLMKELSPGLDKLSNTLSKEINHIAVLLIEEGVKMAVKCAFTTCLQWGLPVEEGGFSLMTYQATIRRNGEYKSKASGNINFNEDLVTPLISSITIEWNNFFSSELWDILDKYKQEIQQTYRTFTNALCKELHSLNLSMTDLKKTRSLLDLHVKNLLTEMIIDLEKVVANRQRNINRMFTPIIKERLMETYDKCKKEKGKGVFNRIKLKLQAGVDHSKCTMFDEASYTVQSQLKQLMKEVISKIWDVCQKICEISSTLYEPFWDSSEASKQLKTTLYDDITEAALTISDLCSKTGVELPLRAATSTEPMSHTASPQMSPSTRAVTSPTEISITSSSRSEIHQLPTSVYSVNDMPSCSTTNVRTESYPEKPPKEKKPRIPESSKRKSSDDEDDKPQRKPVAKRPKMAAFSDSDMSEEEFMPKKRKAVTKSVQVKIELGHRAQRESPSPDGYTHDWRVYVRGPEGCNIAHFIEKVVFHLHQSFPHPKRVVSDPPYQVTERGYAGFLLPIDIYFKNKKKPKKISFQYDLFLLNLDDTPVNHIQCEKLTFQNPTEEFKKKLLKAGGVKMDTRLAPEHRQKLSDDQKERFDNCVNNQNCSDLYLTELKEGKKVGKSKKTFLKDDDVGLLVHDSEVVKKVTYKCKLLQFHMDDSPYYGTWTKKATNVGPRTPFKLIRINAQSSRPSTPLSPGSSKQSSVSQCVTPQKAIPLSPSVSTMPEKERLRMKRMISKVNKKNFKGETPLHTACIKNDVLKLGQLLKVPGVNVNIQDNAGWTPMHEACNHGSTQCVKELLRFVPAKPVEHYFSKDGPRCKKVDLLISNADGITPLHDAVNNNRKDICLLLLQHAGPVLLKQKTVDGYTPLDLASDDDIADLLLSFSDEQITGTSFR